LAESREERLRSALSELVSRSAEVDAAAVVSMDGLVMASVLPNTLEEDRLGAMSRLGERTSEELGRGELAQVFVEGNAGYVFLMAAGEDAVLTALVRKGSKLGLVLYDVKGAAKKIAEIIKAEFRIEYD
jgi:predicted regulator of Ras-like GTPase activity (Roadblock/LC7/MglB family)